MRALLLLLLLLAVLGPGRAHLYDENDHLVSLEKVAHSLLLNSSTCYLAQFYASWCGHCQGFRSNWLTLAEDVKDWRPATYLAVLDCAEESNSKTCNDFGVKGYPSIKFFNAYSKSPSEGIQFKSSDRSPQQLREFIIDKLEAQKESPPPACPPLEPISAPEVAHFFENNDEAYLVLIFEDPKSYMARETALDMTQYEGVAVRRVLQDQSELVELFKVSSFPSGFLLCKNGSVSKINLKEETRAAYRVFLRSLPGVKKVITNLITWSANPVDDTVVKRAVNSSAIYMVDLESCIHYVFRVEMARHSTFHGDVLRTVINYVNMLRKYFPARPYLRTLLDSTYSWLNKQRGKVVAYKDFADIVNNKNQKRNAVLTPHADYVGCQGSKPEYRGFPCCVWTLYHLMTVRAEQLGSHIPQEVLRTMRSYIHYFFGCRYCADHFEEMAAESMSSVRTLDGSIRWLWLSHNRVNRRLAGDATQDPEHPKVQWPTKELCPDCHTIVDNNVTWDEPAVLRFMKKHYCVDNILHNYLVDEAVLLENQKKGIGEIRTIREAENEETDPVKDVLTQPIKANITTVSKRKPSRRRRPSLIKTKSYTPLQEEREKESIVDLDSPYYFPRRTLKDSSYKNGYAIQPEKVLDLPDSEFDQDVVRARLFKKGVDANAIIGVLVENGDVNWRGRWVRMLEVGFSRLDIGICVTLYFLTTMCILVMYLYLSFRSRLRQRCLCPQP